MVGLEREDDFVTWTPPADVSGRTPSTVTTWDFEVPPDVAAALPAARARVATDIAATRYKMLVFSGFGTVEMRRFRRFASRRGSGRYPAFF